MVNTNKLLLFTHTSRPPRLFRLSGFQEPGRGRFRNRTEKRQKEGGEIDLNAQSTSTVLCKYRYDKSDTAFGGPLGGGGSQGRSLEVSSAIHEKKERPKRVKLEDILD